MLWHFCFLLAGVVCIEGVAVTTTNEEVDNSNSGYERVGDAADLDQLLGAIVSTD